MGAFGIGGDSKSKQETVDISGGSFYNRKGTIVQGEGLLLDLRKGGQYNETLSSISTEGDLTLNFGAGDDTFAKMTDSLNSSLAEAFNATAESQEKALEKLSKLAESAQTGGDSGRNQIILYVVLAVLALLGLTFYKRK